MGSLNGLRKRKPSNDGSATSSSGSRSSTGSRQAFKHTPGKSHQKNTEETHASSEDTPKEPKEADAGAVQPPEKTSSISPTKPALLTAKPLPPLPSTSLSGKITSLTAQIASVQSELSTTYSQLRAHLRTHPHHGATSPSLPTSASTPALPSEPRLNDRPIAQHGFLPPSAARTITTCTAISASPTPSASASKVEPPHDQTLSNSKARTCSTSTASTAHSTASTATLASSSSSTREADDVVTAKVSQVIVSRHVKRITTYNELRDTALGLIGLIAEERGTLFGNVSKEFGVGKDKES